jgi:cytochrome bd-type quinol oxidase subunit 2
MNELKLLAQIDLHPITGLGKFIPQGAGLAGKSAAGGMLETIFSNALAIFTIIGGLMFVLYFVLGALSWITAGGATDKIEKAKNQMINAAIGLIIIVAAFAIISIISLVLGLHILNPAEELEKIRP